MDNYDFEEAESIGHRTESSSKMRERRYEEAFDGSFTGDYRYPLPSSSGRDSNAEFLDRRIRFMSIREEPNLPKYSVPPPGYRVDSNPTSSKTFQSSSGALQDEQRYFPLIRNSQINPSIATSNSGNEEGRLDQRTSSAPHLMLFLA